MGKGHKRPATPSPATPPLELPLEDTAPGPPAPDAGPDGMSGPGLTPGVSRNGPQKWKKAQQVNHQVEREAGWPNGRTVQGVSTTPKVKIKMKKLMIAVAAAAMIGAASAKCKPGETSPTYDATVYSVKISLKTPKGELCGGKTASGSPCAPGTKGVDGYVRTPSTYALQGYFANCSGSCDILKNFTQNDIALWNTREKLFLATPVYKVDFIHVLSKSQKNAEIKFSLSGAMNNAKGDAPLMRKFDLVAAGFGKYSPSADIFTSFSGNVVGTG